jgi:hypothetical protein
MSPSHALAAPGPSLGLTALAAAGVLGVLTAWPTPDAHAPLRGPIGFDPLSLLRGAEAVPFLPAPTSAAAPFVLASTGAADRARATRCLADAVYYEAATEPSQGRRAVAQVVLNRLRDPHFPKTICGVVFDGWRGVAGCQFSFACDGSLRRPPDARLYAGALEIAGQALSGRVEPAAGLATYYHATSVAPAWRADMVKVARIGSQIFYRRPDAARAPGAAGSYAGGEHAPAREDLLAWADARAAAGRTPAPAPSPSPSPSDQLAAAAPEPYLWGRPVRSHNKIALMNRLLEQKRPPGTAP